MALSPLDGRYAKIGEELSPYFSEYALVKYRYQVEIKWLKYFLERFDERMKGLSEEEHDAVLDAVTAMQSEFSEDSFFRVKEIEKTTRHDVKAVELYIAEQLREKNLNQLVSAVHIGCTSEDINNIAYASMINDALTSVWVPAVSDLLDAIQKIANEHKGTPMLGHTHGQPATPTTIGKEMSVFLYRMSRVWIDIADRSKTPVCMKFNGATGNYSALSIAFPNVNWPNEMCQFIERNFYYATFNPITTQIESHDYICSLADKIRHFNNILKDFDLDMWLYISKEYIKQVPVKGEVGSSTMPHKVNPINFENSESNCGMSNAVLMELSNKLPCSRMQRDLSDSSTMRNIGIAIGYSLQAIRQTTAGLKKVAVNEAKLEEDLNNKWEVLAEPIQTVLRKYGIPDAYNQLKELTRGKQITKEDIQNFIMSLDVLSEEDRQNLLNLTPTSYVGFAEKLATQVIKHY